MHAIVPQSDAPTMSIMIIILTIALVGATAFVLGKLNDPVGRELDGMRAHVELRNVMTPLFDGHKD